MTDQPEFTPEIKAEAERLWAEAFRENNGYLPQGRALSIGCAASLALCRLLVATGFKPPVDPIEAKAREIVAEQMKARNIPEPLGPQKLIDGIIAGKYRLGEIAAAKAGILAGMEMGK